MGRINAVRIINLNYNNNSIKVNDEIMYLNGESTLISLHNGGGKSVLVQMMSAPFVHSKYRNAKDRPFDSYFTTGRPTFILLEWLLDGGNGKVMTGYMIRQNQENDDENTNSLDITSVIAEYDSPCIYDIQSLPVVEKTKKEIVLKSYAECKNIFENLKKEYSRMFSCYDMNFQAQARQYFDRLKEYKIDYREWEQIIKKINEKESGLSDLFADCKTESGLVDKWLLDTVEKKLDPEKEKIKNFRDIIGKYAKQYRENESKIKQRDYINIFKDNVISEGANPSVKNLALDYNDAILARNQHESKILAFRNKLNDCKDDSGRKSLQYNQELKEMEEKIRHVIYEQYSFEIYEIEKKLDSLVRNREQISVESSSMERQLERLNKEIGIMECAGKYSSYCEEKAALEEKNLKLKLLHEKDEDKRPKLKELGAKLHKYYLSERNSFDSEIEEIRSSLEELSKKISEDDELLSKIAEELLSASKKEGKLNFEIENFSEKEEDFNREFKQNFARNILGRYEEGIFEIKLKLTEKDISESGREQKKTAEKLNETIKNLELTDKEKLETERLKSRLEEKMLSIVSDRELLEGELEKRKNIAKILQADNFDLLDADKLVLLIGKKLEEIDAIIDELHEKTGFLENELKCLKEGRLLQLPSEYIDYLERNGIHIVYGMEWLYKNSQSAEENIKLVRENPFLPYSLIMTEDEINRLKETEERVYLSLPVPIVLRTELENGKVLSSDGIVDFENIHFLINFDEKLLDEEQLIKEISLKEKDIDEIKSRVAIRISERDDYYSKRALLENQSLTKERYENVKAEEKNCRENIKSSAEKIEALAVKNAEDLRKRAELEEKSLSLNEKLISLDKLKSALARFSNQYDAYIEALEKKAALDKETEKLKNREKLTKNARRTEYEKEAVLRNRLHDREITIKDISKELSVFGIYDFNDETELISPDDISAHRAEYNALSSMFSGEISELESDIKRISKKLDGLGHNLERTAASFAISEDDYKNSNYDEFLEDRLKAQKAEVSDKLKNSNAKYNSCENQIAATEQSEKNALRNMKKEVGEESPLPLEEIVSSDFDARKNILENDRKLLEAELKKTEDKISLYSGTLDGMSEFDELDNEETFNWDIDLAGMEREELTELVSSLKKEYNGINNDIQRKRNLLSDRLSEVINLDELVEEQYKKPLRSMLRMLDRPSDIIEQIDITVHALDALMQKLEVDIQMVEKERDEIVDQLSTYLEQINLGLSKIDSNSTIKIQDRPVKMLQITVPSWNESEELYRIRLRDYIDELTLKIVGILNNNENPENELGSRVNVNKIFDAIVGIGNVGIQIYKIEKQRAYPISWSDAAKNSGGEGFLSTFVILSSLLYYIRRDENDLFADKNEGKVLLMDNPFAQTNAEHLLKPLMEIAKKNNTQLICLSGLGGESIYSRFDNIYVLNLVQSRLSNGKQYLNIEHMRGAEPLQMETAHLEVYEQMTLF